MTTTRAPARHDFRMSSMPALADALALMREHGGSVDVRVPNEGRLEFHFRITPQEPITCLFGHSEHQWRAGRAYLLMLSFAITANGNYDPTVWP